MVGTNQPYHTGAPGHLSRCSQPPICGNVVALGNYEVFNIYNFQRCNFLQKLTSSTHWFSFKSMIRISKTGNPWSTHSVTLHNGHFILLNLSSTLFTFLPSVLWNKRTIFLSKGNPSPIISDKDFIISSLISFYFPIRSAMLVLKHILF